MRALYHNQPKLHPVSAIVLVSLDFGLAVCFQGIMVFARSHLVLLALSPVKSRDPVSVTVYELEPL